METTENTLLVEWEPYFLQEDDLWLEFAEQVGEVVLVSLHTLNIERDH